MAQVMEREKVEEIISGIISGSKMALLATVDGNRPWVRYMATVDVKGTFKLQSSTSLQSRKVAHVKANPNVHITLGCESMEEMKPYVQYVAKCKVLTDEKSKKDHWQPHLEQYFQSPDNPNYCVLEFEPETIEVWGATEDHMHPLIWKAH